MLLTILRLLVRKYRRRLRNESGEQYWSWESGVEFFFVFSEKAFFFSFFLF